MIVASLMLGSFLCARSPPRLSKTPQEIASKVDRTNSKERLKELIVAVDAYGRSQEKFAGWLHMMLLVACASGLVVGGSNLQLIHSERASHDKKA